MSEPRFCQCGHADEFHDNGLAAELGPARASTLGGGCRVSICSCRVFRPQQTLYGLPIVYVDRPPGEPEPEPILLTDRIAITGLTARLRA